MKWTKALILLGMAFATVTPKKGDARSAKDTKALLISAKKIENQLQKKDKEVKNLQEQIGKKDEQILELKAEILALEGRLAADNGGSVNFTQEDLDALFSTQKQIERVFALNFVISTLYSIIDLVDAESIPAAEASRRTNTEFKDIKETIKKYYRVINKLFNTLGQNTVVNIYDGENAEYGGAVPIYTTVKDYWNKFSVVGVRQPGERSSGEPRAIQFEGRKMYITNAGMRKLKSAIQHNIANLQIIRNELQSEIADEFNFPSVTLIPKNSFRNIIHER